MNDIETGGPAFPCEISGIDEHGEYRIPYQGMSLRDYFAVKSISAMLAPNPVTGQFATVNDFDYCAINAYKMADAMLKARKIG